MSKICRLGVGLVVGGVSKVLFSMTIPMLKVTLRVISTSRAMKAWAIAYLERGLE